MVRRPTEPFLTRSYSSGCSECRPPSLDLEPLILGLIVYLLVQQMQDQMMMGGKKKRKRRSSPQELK